jgi:hydroxylamine reductase (hybrid-cluster protein)
MPTPDEMINELVARADAYMEHKHVIKPQKKQKKVLDNYLITSICNTPACTMQLLACVYDCLPDVARTLILVAGEGWQADDDEGGG